MNEPRLYLPKHHSIGDWDFSLPTWQISAAQYISPPTSILFVTASGAVTGYLLCKYTPCLTLPQGRLVTYLRTASISYMVYFIFRNKLAPGSSNTQNCYQIRFSLDSSQWILIERLAGLDNRTWTQTKSTQIANTWYRFRVSWWLIGTLLNVKLELEVAGVWTQQGNTIAVSNPLFGNETYQRCGYGLQYRYQPYPTYVDDTEIWAYVP